jgi:hypothetical protein
MAEIEFLDALNDCIDRLNAGQSLDECVADYPQHAERLRQLLSLGTLVYQAQQYPGAEVAGEQAQARQQVVEALRIRRETQVRSGRASRSNILFAFGAIAAMLVVVSIAVLVLVGPAVGNIFSNLVRNLKTGSDYNTGPIAAVASTFPTTDATLIAMAATATPAPTLTKIDLVPTSAALMSPVAVLSTPTPGVFGTPLPTIPRQDVALTATSLVLLLLPPTSTPERLDSLPTAVPFLPTDLPPGVNETQVAHLTTIVTPSPTATTTPTVTPTPSPAGTQAPSATPLPINLGSDLLPTVIPLSAGEIDDNTRWDTYLLYRRNYLAQYAQSVRDVDVTGRQIIAITNEAGLPVLGARVRVYVGQTLVSETRTMANGMTLFFPNARLESRGAQSYRVGVDKGQSAGEFTLDPARGSVWKATLPGVNTTQNAVKLDVLFLLDATGSMADEIAQLQNNILGISAQIAALPGNVDVRYGLVTYRDRGDEYITRLYDFVPDVKAFQASLNSVVAANGGDTPESLNEALHKAVQEVTWRGEDTVKLIFLVADAPPHLDYPNDYRYDQEMAAAAGRGIKIHPIASSGLSPDGEYIFRQIAQYTMGHFLFLTYQQGTAGAPGETRSDLHVGTPANPTQGQQGDYTVEQLDELVMRLIKDELAALSKPTEVYGAIGIPLTPVGALPTQSSQLVPSNPAGNFSLPLVVALVGLSLFSGYLLARRPTDKPKCKNDEVIEPDN